MDTAASANGSSNHAQVGTARVKRGMAEMLKGGVIMDVVNAEQARIAEAAGAVAVMALERVPADIRAQGGVARMSDPDLIDGIIAAVSIPVMAKARIGHFVEAQILASLGVDYVDESEVLTPAPTAASIRRSTPATARTIPLPRSPCSPTGASISRARLPKWTAGRAPASPACCRAPPRSRSPRRRACARTALSATETRVSWTNIARETGYRLERSADGQTGWSPLGTVGANVTQFTDHAGGSGWHYRVIALGPAGESQPSDDRDAPAATGAACSRGDTGGGRGRASRVVGCRARDRLSRRAQCRRA